MLFSRTNRIIAIMALAFAVVGACFTVGYPHNGAPPIPEDGTTFPLPGGIADGFRAVVMAQVGWSLGLLALVIQRFVMVKIARADHFSRALGFLSLSYFMLAVYCGLDIVSRLGHHWISYRTPFAFIAFAVSDIALVVLYNRVTDVIIRAKAEGAIIKLTVMDTHVPGIIIDLDD